MLHQHRIRALLTGVVFVSLLSGTLLLLAPSANRVTHASGGTGAINFALPTSYSVPDAIATPSSIGSAAVGVLRPGHRPDIVTGDSDGKVSVFLNNGDGTFASAVTYTASSSYHVNGVAIADADGDGKPDIIAAIGDGSGATGIAVLLGNGDGTFQVPISSSTAFSCGSSCYEDTPISLAAADFNQDGKVDVAVGFYPGGANATVVRTFNGDGAGHFTPSGTSLYVTNTYGIVSSLTVADLNKDGAPDLIASNNNCGYNSGNIAVFINSNNGSGGFTGTQNGLECPTTVAVADVNKDGIPDLVTTTGVVLQNGRQVTIWGGKGDGTFPTTVHASLGINPTVTALADFAGNGNLDLVAADGCDSIVNIAAGNGDGTFQPPAGGSDGDCYGVQTSDLTGSGVPDIVTVGSSEVSVILAVPPAGTGASVIGGAVLNGGVGATGVSVEACPTGGGACLVDPTPTGFAGTFALRVPSGSYTVTALTSQGPISVGPVPSGTTNVRINLLNLSAPPGTLVGPAVGTGMNGIPGLRWDSPATYTVTGCKGGFGYLSVGATNTTTGQPDTRAFPLVETPPGSGTYVADITPVAPLHGLASVIQEISCPGRMPLLPNGGDTAGGTQVIISGSGFSGAQSVLFGTTPASSFTVASDTNIVATSPGASAGPVQVSVVTSTNTQVPIGTFAYLSVSGVTPNTGPATGGTTVTITGQGLAAAAGVLFGNVYVPRAQLQAVNATQIVMTSPWQAPSEGNVVDIQVATTAGISTANSSDRFTYTGGLPSPTQSVPSGSPPTPAASSIAGSDPVEGSHYGIDGTDLLLKIFGLGSFFAGIKLGDLRVISLPGIADAMEALQIAFPTLGPLLVDLSLLTVANVLGAALLGVDLGLTLWHAFFDPSGTVIDTAGNPVSGATATILNQSSPGGPFSAVPAASGAIQPAVNPETTNASGGFDWDALAGTYEIQASAPNCHAPGNPSQSSVSTAPFVIPPPVIGLQLTLECSGATPPTPRVTGVSPNAGVTAGWNPVEITGSGMATTTAVHFGSVAATNVTVLSPYAIVATAPPGTATVDVTVTTAGGTSAVSAADQYTYVSVPASPQAPWISSLSVSSGPVTGGTLVTITGSNLMGATSVAFGGIPSTQVTQLSGKQLRAVSPAGLVPGRVDVSVGTAQGISAVSIADSFVYVGGTPLHATATTLTSTADPSVAGAAVTFTATVSGGLGGAGTPTGPVAFLSNGVGIPGCSLTSLSSGSATCMVSYPAAGSQNVTAVYSGDSSYAGSSSAVFTQIVASGPCATLAGCNLQGLNLSHANLAGANLSGANLSNADLDGANLSGANLTGSNLSGASLISANLTGGNLTGASLAAARLVKANLSKANLSSADLTGATLVGANLRGVMWNNTTCPDGTNSGVDGGTCVGHV
jgi:hypothetical protein